MSRSFIIETPEQLAKLCTFLSKRDLPFQIEYGAVRLQRSLAQNSRLWALHKLASEVTGHSVDEMHEFALCRFFGHNEVKLGGVVRQIPLKRSSARDKAEFAAFMESTEAWYIEEFGIWLGD